MIVLIKQDDLLDDYKKISKIERVNYIFNATDSPKVRDCSNVLTDFDTRTSTVSAISESIFQIPQVCYDASFPKRTIEKKLDAFFSDPSFTEICIRLISEQILHPDANYLITLSNSDYETFHSRYMDAFADILRIEDCRGVVFLYDDTKGMFNYTYDMLKRRLEKIDEQLEDDDENDDLLDSRDDILDALNMLEYADSDEVSNKKARKIVRKTFLNNAVIRKKTIKELTKIIKSYSKGSESDNPYARENRKKYDDDDD